jgi:uncharacterized protein
VERSRIAVDGDKLAEFCRRNYIRRFALFGSVLRENFRPDSDVDVLVEFEPGHVPGLRFFGLGKELSEILGRKVDLNSKFFEPIFPIAGLGRGRGSVCRVIKATYAYATCWITPARQWRWPAAELAANSTLTAN